MAEKIAPEKLLIPASEEQPFKEKEQPSRKKKNKKSLEGTSKFVTEKKACEFLKFIKHSEYSVIEQLNKTPTRISLLSLFQSSKTHCNALLKALGEAYVTPTISVDGIDQLVGNITASTCIAFIDEEIPQKVEIALKPSTLLSNARTILCHELFSIMVHHSM